MYTLIENIRIFLQSKGFSDPLKGPGRSHDEDQASSAALAAPEISYKQ